MNIEYIVFNNQLIIKDKNNSNNNVQVNNINFYFMIISVLESDCIEQWFWYNIESNNIINTIQSIKERGSLFCIQINLAFCNQMNSKFIQYLRNTLFHEFNTQLQAGYLVLITKREDTIKSTTGSFVKLAIHTTFRIDFSKHVQNGIITPEVQEREKKLIEEHHKFLKDKVNLERDQNKLLERKEEMMDILDSRKDEIEKVRNMTKIIEAEENKLLQIYEKDKAKKIEIDKKTRDEEVEKLIAKQEEEGKDRVRLLSERERLVTESKRIIKEKNDTLIKEMRERYQKELLISQDNAEKSKQLLNDLESERARLDKVVSGKDVDEKIVQENREREYKEKVKEYLEKQTDQFLNSLNEKYQKERRKNKFEDATSKLLEEHQKIQEQIYQERLQNELSKFVHHRKEQNDLLDSLNTKREQINKKVQSSDSKELKEIVNEMDKYFQEKKSYFDNNIEKQLHLIRDTINGKVNSIENRRKTLAYVEQLNKQKVMWIKLLQNQVKQYNKDQDIIDQYIKELDTKYRTEVLNAIKMFKSNVNSIVDENKIKKDLTNIIQFREERKRLLKQYNNEYSELKGLEDNYNKNRKEYADTMQQIVKEWSDKKSEKYNKKREDEQEKFEKMRVKYLKSCEEALQFNFDRFVNKCEEIRDKFKFGRIEQFVQRESDEKIKQLAQKEIENQQKQWGKLNDEKIRLDNVLKEQKRLQLEEKERREKNELEMRRERKRLMLEEKRRKIREERAARKKGLNKSLRIW